MSILRFFRENARWLGAGVLLSFASSFGQTYFISLFSAEIRGAYGLSDGDWGVLYTAGTLISAALLIQAGKLADHYTTRSLAMGVLVIYALVALSMSANESVYLLVAVIAGLRFCGQGMMSHLCMTAMGRWFAASRGRAVAVAGLGFSLGEALLPGIVAGLEPLLGWRGIWVAAAVVLVAVYLPAIRWLTASERRPQGDAGGDGGTAGLGARHWTRRDAMRHWLFWAILPGVLAPPFIGTSVFFHAVHLSEVKGWDFSAIAAAYPVYAVVTVCFSFVAGSLIDRFGAASLLPGFLLPLAAGMTVLGLGNGEGAIFVAFALMGVSQGTVTAFFGALWPELYGTRHLGAVRAVAISAMVISTAVGPGVTGSLIDLGVPFVTQALFMAAYCVAISATFLAVARRITSERALG